MAFLSPALAVALALGQTPAPIQPLLTPERVPPPLVAGDREGAVPEPDARRPVPAAGAPSQGEGGEPRLRRPAPPAPNPADPSRAIWTLAFGTGWSYTQFGQWVTPQPLVPESFGRHVEGVDLSLHARFGLRRGLLDLGATLEGGAIPFGSGQLLAAADVGLTGALREWLQGSLRAVAAWHRLLYVGHTVGGGGLADPLDLPAVGAELELRMREFAVPSARPWSGLSFCALFDLGRPRAASPPPSRNGDLHYFPEAPTVAGGGYMVGMRLRIGFDLT